LIEALRALCAALRAPDATPESVAAALGSIVASSTGAIAVDAADGAFGEATVVRTPEGGIAYVELELTEPRPLQALTDTFGEGSTPPRLHLGEPETRSFRGGDCRIIAGLDDDGLVTTVTLNHDVV
jgi:hypothetical protein